MLLFHHNSKEIEIRKQMQTVIRDQAEVFFPFSHGSMLVCQSLVITLNILSSCWCPLVKLELLHSAQHRPVSQVRERPFLGLLLASLYQSCSLIGWYHAPAHPYITLSLYCTAVLEFCFINVRPGVLAWHCSEAVPWLPGRTGFSTSSSTPTPAVIQVLCCGD